VVIPEDAVLLELLARDVDVPVADEESVVMVAEETDAMVLPETVW
jgi:hypothetical protein